MSGQERRVAVLGLGRMGQALARRLLARGFSVTVYNRTAAPAEALGRAGARVASRPCEAVEPGGVAVSALTDEAAVQQMCDGEGGLLPSGFAGGTHLSLSTLPPGAAMRLAQRHAAAGVRYLSVPVQGRPAMALAGQLVAWISGPAPDAAARGVIDAFARRMIVLGEDVRHAPAAKLALNMLMNANIELFAEAFAYAGSHGLDLRVFADGLTQSAFAAPLFQAIAAGLLRDDDRAEGSDVRVSRKDLGLLSADLGRLQLPLAQTLEGVYARAEARGLGDLDPCAVRRLLRLEPA